jgi:UPF0042 nucleotide-binding protein
MPLKKIVSFGFKYPDLPEVIPGVVVVDVRNLFRNPHRDRSLRYKTGQDPLVQAEVMKTPEFHAKYSHVKAAATSPGTEVAFIGCHGGKHRSVFLAERLGQELGIPVEHRDMNREVADVLRAF